MRNPLIFLVGMAVVSVACLPDIPENPNLNQKDQGGTDTGSASGDDADNDGFTVDEGDCNDGNNTIYPGADELCDGFDNNCDGATDEPAALDTTTWYKDNDQDGHGDPNVSINECDQPQGYVINPSDCNDFDDNVYPEATEVPYDDIDQDCDGSDLTPYTGGWVPRPCATDPVASSNPPFDEGDVVSDFGYHDSYGDPVRLYDFCDTVVIVFIGAMWSGPDLQRIVEAQALYSQFEEDGLMVLSLWVYNVESEIPTTSELVSLRNDFGLTFPVLAADPDQAVDDYALYYFPTVLLLNAGMEMQLPIATSLPNEGTITALLDQLR